MSGARASSEAERELARLHASVIACERCPALRDYCSRVAREKRRAYADWDYWGRPVPGFGDALARIWILGLAPAAHGGNRTGRVFTGDRSGDFLYAALHRARLANQSEATSRDDGLSLRDVYVSAAARCAPPANRPARDELARCSSYLDAELSLLARVRVIVCLGGIAWNAALDVLKRSGRAELARRPPFAHGAELAAAGVTMIGSYHVSQQNTFTGRLTAAMFDAVLARAREIARARA